MATEAYTWRAISQDGTALDEHDTTHGFASVDQSHIKSVLLLHNDEPLHQVDIPEGAQSVFFRRRSIEMSLEDERAIDRGTVHCIGWKRDDDAVYLFIAEDGKTLLTNDLQAV